MKSRTCLTILCMVVFGLMLSQPPAFAHIVSFGDSSHYWPGWQNGSPDDSKDVIGIPNLKGGEAELTGGLLTKLTFENATLSSSYWGVLAPGDLFIDVGSDGAWDYVVNLASSKASGNYTIYSFSSGLSLGSPASNPGYILSGKDNTGSWAGYLIRDNHPVAWNVSSGGTANGSAYFSGWGSTPEPSYSFTFAGLNVGHDFTVGWTLNCANDVIYERVAVPEPATMLLLGFGLVGLSAVGRKRMRVSQ